ncbi:MAG: gamma-glutamyl-gamma-aminobutyrate hydrolase family protein [Thaumarchaeota archaeon]|nr:gamma-glutamyl-gamma-aminobutyrate hydrolase family protein [Nitrososphaerota archaeon]MDE1867765.1 gamma-glutamyl-gamma-aminobutyrate hydrolase family protein [Nitrososphaerota archaeon]
MSDVLVIQNTRNEGIATLGRLFEKDGFGITTVLAKKEKIPSINPRVIVILGAPESANDDLPYLKEELALIQDSVKKDIPVLGICLGSQLIAKAFGATVYQGKRKEIGFYHDIKFEHTESRLFQGISSPATVFHWHGDTFSLPKNAIRLAHSKDYQNQAIKIGSAVGIQFHLEVDQSTIQLWLDKSKEELSTVPYIKPEDILKGIPENIDAVQNNMQAFYQNFKSEFKL